MKTLLATGNETVERGLVNVIDKIRYKTNVPRLSVTNLIGPKVVTPTTSYGTSTIDNRVLQPTDAMLYHEFRPRDYEDLWMPWSPSGQLVFRELNTKAQVELLTEVAKHARSWVGNVIWQGDSTLANAAPYYNLVNGLVYRAKNDTDVIDVTGTAITTPALALAAIKAVYDATPAHVRNNPNYRIFASDADCEFYIDAIHNQANKGNDFTQSGPLTYKGKPIERLVGMPAGIIIGTHSSASRDSNLHIGLDWDEASVNAGTEVIKLDRLQANSEMFFMRMDFKMDTQIAWGQELVLFQP